jgi:hypothetical protein
MTLHQARDVLDDDDRIIDNEPGRKRQAEQRERIDLKVQRRDQSECSDERDGNRNGRYQGRAPVLKEEVNHDNDQQDRDR